MSWSLAFALLSFAWLCYWSSLQIQKDVYNEPPPPIAPRRERDRRGRRRQSSSSLAPIRDDPIVSEEAIEKVQERILAARPTAGVIPAPVPVPNVTTPPVEPAPAQPRAEHPNDLVRREMGLSRQPPPHLDMRNRERQRFAPALSPAAAEQARNNARRPSRRSNDKPVEHHHCGSCNRSFKDLYSFDQHNLLRHPEAPRKPTSAEESSEVNVPVDSSCETCLRTFDSALALLQHNSACHPVLWAAGCFQCGVPRFKTGEDARIHFRRVHPGRTISPTLANPAVRATSQRNLNPTLKDTVLTAEPDLTLPDLQRTYGCELCSERFSTSEEREAHRASPFAHGDQTALAAAFPPLSASPSSNSSFTSMKPSTIKDTPGPSPPVRTHTGEDSSSVGSLSLDSAPGETEKPFSSLHWALSSEPELPPVHLEEEEPSLVHHEPLVISDEDWVTPWINDPPAPEPEFPVHHAWQETDPADIPLPPSPIIESDPAVSVLQPLPSFSVSQAEVDDRIPFDHPAPAELVIHVSVGHGNPDGEESVIVPSPFKFGEIIPDPVPPGIEAFPELPARLEAATPKAKPEAITSRWHTDEKPDFALPDLSPKPKADVRKQSAEISPLPQPLAELPPLPASTNGSPVKTESVISEESPKKKLSRWDSASPKKASSRWAEDSPPESSPDRLDESDESAPRPARWGSEKDSRTYEVDDEYADEIPAPFAGASAPVTGTNNIPLGRPRMAVAGGGSSNPPPSAPVHQSRYAAPPPVPRPTFQGGFPSDRSTRSMQQPYPVYGQPLHLVNGNGGYSGGLQLNSGHPAHGGYQPNGGYQSHGLPANGGYQSGGLPQRTQHYGNNGGYTANGSFSQTPPPPQPYSEPEHDRPTTVHVQQQMPSFDYADDASFNAFANTNPADDPLAPLPAPVHAQPSAWAAPSSNPPPVHQPVTMSPPPMPSPMAPLSYSSSVSGPKSPGAYRSGGSDVSETSSGGSRFGAHFGGAIGPVVTPHVGPGPGPGTRGRWADRAGAGQYLQQQQQQQAQSKMLPPHMAPPPMPAQPPAPRFDASSGWTTSIPTPAPRRSYGGKPINESYSEKQARLRQEEADKLKEIAVSEEEGFGGW